MTVITSSPTQFGKLLDIQKGALDQLITLRQVVENSKSLQAAQASASPNETEDKRTEELIKVEKELVKVNKDQLELEQDRLKKMEEEAKLLTQLVSGFKTFKTPIEKLQDAFKSTSAAFQNPGKSLMKMLNVGGAFNKQIAKSDFVEKQKALGSTKSDKELKEDFKQANKASIAVQDNEKKLDELKKKTGISNESALAKTPEGRKLLDTRAKTTEEYKKYDIGAQIQTDSSEPKAPLTALNAPAAAVEKTPTSAFASAGEQQEAQVENARMMGDQTSLLQKIEENTRPGGSTASKASEAGSGGGLLGGIGAGLGALGKGIGKGMQSLLSGVGRGLISLSVGLAALANPLTLVGLGAATVAIMGIGKALQMAAPAIEAFAPVLMKIADVIGNVFIKAIETIPKVISAIGDVIMGVISTISNSIIGIVDAVTSSIERLASIDGSALLSVAGGLLALSGAMVAFGGAQALAGLGTLVSKFLTLGADSPVEQLIKIGQNGEGVIKAAEGMEKISHAMVGFSKIDKKSMEAVNDFPWVRATAFVAAGGAMSAGGAKVYNASKKNADEEAKVAGAVKGGGNTVVSAPTVNNTTRQSNIIRVPVRNRDNSVASWLQSRYTG
jgi:hypothetical protein